METLIEALRGDIPAQQWSDTMLRSYPFFAIPLARQLTLCPADASERRSAMLMRLRLLLPSAEATARLAPALGGAAAADLSFESFYPPMEKPATPDTNSAIDDFLARYANTTPEEEAMLERMILNPVPDYERQLAAQADSELPEAPAPGADSREARISRFILADRARRAPAASEADTPEIPIPEPPVETPPAPTAQKAPATRRRSPSPEPPANSLLSESLAKIYIKSHKYERAYEILTRLSLEFPEKNRYFADQLRFLRKLIFIEQHRRDARTSGNDTITN